MQPLKPQMDVQSKKPAMKPSNKKSIGLNKNCEATVGCKKQKKCKYMMTFKVNLPSVLTRTVKKRKITICSQ